MSTEDRFKNIVDRYRSQGYQVTIGPKPDELPPFAKDFKVEILATRPDGGVLVTAKKNLSEFQANRDLSRYAEVTEQQNGWRYDVFVLEPEEPMPIDKKEAIEPTEQEIRQNLQDASKMLKAGFVAPSLISAWAALESAMRRRLRVHGSNTKSGTSSRTMLNELFSAGDFNNSVFRDLEGMFQLRSMVVHGFTGENVETSAVQFVIDTARGLLDSPFPTKKTA